MGDIGSPWSAAEPYSMRPGGGPYSAIASRAAFCEKQGAKWRSCSARTTGSATEVGLEVLRLAMSVRSVRFDAMDTA